MKNKLRYTNANFTRNNDYGHPPYYETSAVMNNRESENYLSISRSSSASK